MTNDKHATDKLIGVPETMLVPLYARALETQRENGLIRDEQAVEMVAKIDYDFAKFSPNDPTVLGIAIRTEILDEAVSEYIAQFPDCVIINIAAGLDARFFRMDNGHIRWYDIDLPESIDLRRKLIAENDRLTFIAGSVLDNAWIDQIEKRPNTLFIIEGLLMYFEEAVVKQLLITIAERFPGSEALIEVAGVSQAKKTLSDAIRLTSARLVWGIRHAEELSEWDERITYLSDISLYDRHEDRWLAQDVKWPVPPSELRNTINRIVHLQFAD